jgi:hypothetical protein
LTTSTRPAKPRMVLELPSVRCPLARFHMAGLFLARRIYLCFAGGGETCSASAGVHGQERFAAILGWDAARLGAGGGARGFVLPDHRVAGS